MFTNTTTMHVNNFIRDLHSLNEFYNSCQNDSKEPYSLARLEGSTGTLEWTVETKDRTQAFVVAIFETLTDQKVSKYLPKVNPLTALVSGKLRDSSEAKAAFEIFISRLGPVGTESLISFAEKFSITEIILQSPFRGHNRPT